MKADMLRNHHTLSLLAWVGTRTDKKEEGQDKKKGERRRRALLVAVAVVVSLYLKEVEKSKSAKKKTEREPVLTAGSKSKTVDSTCRALRYTFKIGVVNDNQIIFSSLVFPIDPLDMGQAIFPLSNDDTQETARRGYSSASTRFLTARPHRESSPRRVDHTALPERDAIPYGRSVRTQHTQARTYSQTNAARR